MFIEPIGGHLQQTTDQLYELGRLYFDRGDFAIAEDKFKRAAQNFLTKKQFAEYLECQNFLLRIHAERDENEQIMIIKESLQDLLLKEGLQLSSRTYYTLGVCASYRYQHDISQDYFQKALSLALKEDNKSDICYAILGLAICYTNTGRLSEALKEVYNLKVFFEVIDLPLLKISSSILNGKILYKLGRFDEALEVYWECYDQLKDEQNLALYVKVMYQMGLTYKALGDANLAKVYLQLAGRAIKAEHRKSLYGLIQKQLEDLGVASRYEFDLVLNPTSHVVTERKRGKVDFKNQFVLLDLLHLFMKNPGTVFSKEELVRMVWKQEYDPSVHDNKIYVTIKRLRKMIEPDYERPKYIFRGKTGYYLNKSARIHFEQ